MKVFRTIPKDYPLAKHVMGTGKYFLDDIMSSIDNARLYEAVGISGNLSYVLSGLPGTGKTFAVNALNNQYNQTAIVDQRVYENLVRRLEAQNAKLPKDQRSSQEKIDGQVLRIMNESFRLIMYEYTIGQYGTAYINQSSRNLQTFFNAGIVASAMHPTVLVFDEADSLMGQRGSGRSHNEDNKALQTIMTNLQEAQDNPNLFVILMTNYPRGIDKAVMRAGRINKRYEFSKPTKTERLQVIKRIVQTRNENAGYQVIRNYDPNKIADLTEGFTNADIDQVITETIRKRVREVGRERNDKLIPALYVTGIRLERAILKHSERFRLKERRIGYA